MGGRVWFQVLYRMFPMVVLTFGDLASATGIAQDLLSSGGLFGTTPLDCRPGMLGVCSLKWCGQRVEQTQDCKCHVLASPSKHGVQVCD